MWLLRQQYRIVSTLECKLGLKAELELELELVIAGEVGGRV